jgi:hypothetical protein
MLIKLPPDARAGLAPLFEGFPGLRGVIHSVLEGVLGEAWADDPARPRVAHLLLDFNLIAGDPNAPAAREAILALEAGDHVAPSASVEDLLLDTLGDRLQPYERTEFRAGTWDAAELQTRQALPPGLTLVRVDANTVAAFEALADSLVYNFDSHDDFLRRGVGFGIFESATCIAGCASYAISSHSLEFEIQTHPGYERRGLAMVTGSRMIQHCLESGLEPCWDAAHEGSARLALKLGFVDPRPYTAYRID